MKKRKSIEKIFEEARKSPVYKAELMSLQFWRVVLDVMASKKMTLSQLARKSGVSMRRLKLWLNDSSTMTLEEMGKVTAALDIELNVVVAGGLDDGTQS
jgi:transcriptional regulator with XRE-family HTH domain